MTHQKPEEIRSLADVHRLIVQAKNIQPSSRKEMLSAISRLSKMLGRPLHDIPADLESLRGLIGRLHPVQARVSRKSLSNTRAGINLALRYAGVTEELRVAPKESKQWAAFRNSGTAPHHAYALSRLARYCTASNTEPSDVTDQVMDDYQAHLARATLNRDPAKSRVETAKTFNCVVKLSGLDRPLLTARKGTTYITPSLSAYPTSMQEEISSYLESLRSPAPLLREMSGGRRGKRRPKLRLTSLRNMEHHFRQILDAAVQAGYEPSSFKSLTDLLKPEVLDRAFATISQRIGKETTSSHYNILATLVPVAKYHLGMPDDELAVFQEAKAFYWEELGLGDVGMSDRNIRALEQFDDPENVRRLVCLPEVLIEDAVRCGPTRDSALQAMHSVATTILLACPIRMANLAALELERHIAPVTHGRKISYNIFIPATETKNRVAVEAAIGGIHAQLIQRYLATFRPLLAKDLDRAFFPRPSGGARAPKHLGEGISKLIAHHTGLKMHPHLFRHLAAKLFLEARPGEYESVRRLLNHRKIATTTSFYSPISNRSAQETYHGILNNQKGYT